MVRTASDVSGRSPARFVDRRAARREPRELLRCTPPDAGVCTTTRWPGSSGSGIECVSSVRRPTRGWLISRTPHVSEATSKAAHRVRKSALRALSSVMSSASPGSTGSRPELPRSRETTRSAIASQSPQ